MRRVRHNFCCFTTSNKFRDLKTLKISKKVKETTQSIKAENDNLKENKVEIYAELQHLRDEVKTKRSGSRGNLGEAIKPSSAGLSELMTNFVKCAEDKMGV